MNDDIDDELTTEGERWRASLDADPDLGAMLPQHRPRGLAALAAAVAIVAVGVSTVLLGQSPRGGESALVTQAATPSTAMVVPRTSRPPQHGGAAASCVGPILSAEPNVVPGEATSLGMVPAGDVVMVYGRWYLDGCPDTIVGDAPIPTAAPLDSVILSLTSADHHTRALATAHPGAGEAAFAARITIPTTAAPGPATITDGLGNSIALVIVAR